MSLTPQRPNYVLIWIGIVMLTFSMAGNWILDSSARPTSNLVGSTRSSLDYEDSAILPKGFSNHVDLLSADPLAVEDVFDQMVPLRDDEYFVEELSLAKQENILEPGAWQPFPMETVSEASKPFEDSPQEAIALGIKPQDSVSSQPEQQLHAFQQERGLSRKQKTAARWIENDQYNSSWKGDQHGRAGKSGKNGKGRMGRSILVKSSFTPKGHGRIAVRFFLGNPERMGFPHNRLAMLQGEGNERLAQLTEEYLEAMEEVLREDLDTDPDSGQDAEVRNRTELQRLGQMKAKLRERLMQRPGGIELIAELSPKQLEALFQKLSAQNPKFRALVSS